MNTDVGQLTDTTSHIDTIPAMRLGEQDEASLSYLDRGDGEGGNYLFIHGWPESLHAWREVISAAHESAPETRTVAVDLPGIGRSAGFPADGSKATTARAVHELVLSLGLSPVTVVGHDIGGMVAHSYLRQFHQDDGLRVVIMNTVVPGVDPWPKVLRNPYLWHFAFHSVPGLPERLVHGHQREYFDYFFNELAAEPDTIDDIQRGFHAAAYGELSALSAGFDYYRAFAADAEDNEAFATESDLDTPVLYLRGGAEPGIDIDEYAAGLRSAGLRNVSAAEVPDAGHFAPEENPRAVWDLVHAFGSRQS